MRGVIVTGIADELIAWARLYMEETEAAGADVDGAVRPMTRTGAIDAGAEG
jgi:hypothetical protein